jgi:hypothetical protein
MDRAAALTYGERVAISKKSPADYPSQVLPESCDKGACAGEVRLFALYLRADEHSTGQRINAIVPCP